MKRFLDLIGTWTIKFHWLFLLVIFGGQWLTGQIISEPEEWGWIMDFRLAQQFHSLNGKLIFIALIYMAANKLWLELKRRGKI